MYPDDFARVQYREMKSPALLKTVFAVIVVSETLVCLVLFVGVYMMSRALLGLEDPEAAWVVALLAVLGFTLIWSAFLVFGNWFFSGCAMSGCRATTSNCYFGVSSRCCS